MSATDRGRGQERDRRGGERTPPQGLGFELSGGALCLDLANTVDDRRTRMPRERLVRYTDLVAWGRQSGALDEDRVSLLLRRAGRRPKAAAAALRRVRLAREMLYRVCSAEAQRTAAPPADVVRLNGGLRTALARRRLETRPGAGLAWAWDSSGGALDSVLWPVLLSAAELLTGPDRARIRECADDDCGWLFLDRSRNASRRWCDMAVCGNRAKARRYRSRRGGSG